MAYYKSGATLSLELARLPELTRLVLGGYSTWM